MPTIYDNIEKSLADALRATLSQANRADFCVGYLICAGGGKISDLVAARFGPQNESYARVLVGMTPRPPEEEIKLAQSAIRQPDGLDGPTLARLKAKTAEAFKQQIEFGLPNVQAEHSLQELSRQIKAHQVKVKAFLRYPLHAKLYLILRQDPITPLIGYLGSSNLTQSGLSGNDELNVDVVDQDAAQKLQDWINDRWDDETAAFDIGADLVKLIETSWAREELVPPYLVYLKMICHLSSDARTGQKEFKLPKEFEDVQLEFHIPNAGGIIAESFTVPRKTISL